jgi:hypothetical protein
LRYFCSPQHTDSAFYPIIGQMERAAGLAHDDKPQAKLDKLDAVLAQTSTSTQDAALFAEMLSLPNDGRYLALKLTPQQRRQKTLEALTSQLSGLAREQPVLMVFEDAHWVDPTSLEVLGRTVDWIKTFPALLIGESYRRWGRKYEHDWEKKFREKYEAKMIEKNDTHFFVGNLHQFPNSWIVVGLFYPPRETTRDMFFQ